jgi:hypothetical protein
MKERVVVSAAAAITLLSGVNACSAGPTGPVGDETASQALSLSGPTADCYCKIANIAATSGGGGGETPPRPAPRAQKAECVTGADYSHSSGSYWSLVPFEYISTGPTGATGPTCAEMEGVPADVDSVGAIRSQLRVGSDGTITCGPFAPEPDGPPPPIGLPEPEWVFTACVTDISI